ncbi:hypothetical protein ZIOFF_005777 [Zingiber officinale]|uniref:Transposase-associated domain-containing protein n=1 Tax=Zingiber officinale TaxID=94328 RepID=A0A8J5M1U9_ZINOF|nr:hypothetical protein ZIOFF_005777 [Zingiber officinale]
MKESSVIRCPCILCRNLKFGDLEMVKAYIHLHGFDQTYLIWINHGEEIVDLSENIDVRIDIENDNVINERERSATRHFPSPSPTSTGTPPPVAGSGSRVRILSVDNGGHPSEALLATVSLARLESSLRRLSADPSAPIIDFFNVAAGSGSGGVLAVMLLPEALMTDHSSQPKRRSGSSLSGVDGCCSDPARGGTCGSGYSSEGLGKGSDERSATRS